MQRTLGVIAGLTLAAAAAAPAAAQGAADARPVRFGVQGGISLPTGDDNEGVNTGFTVGGLLDFQPAALPFGIRVNADYHRFGIEDVDNKLSVLAVTGNAKYDFTTASGISPYVIGGVGMYRSSISDCDECESDTEFGFNFGGGLNFNLGTLDTFAEVRYNLVDGSGIVPVVFGIRF